VLSPLSFLPFFESLAGFDLVTLVVFFVAAIKVEKNFPIIND
jgi:hypothetical protein